MTAMTSLPTGTVITTIGDGYTSATFILRKLGEVTELVSVLTLLNGFHEELDRQHADDDGEAIQIATDMEWAAVKTLKDMDVDFYKEPAGFPEALERHLGTNSAYPIAAE
jgi:hypothetical protein